MGKIRFSQNKFSKFIAGKGFYLALALSLIGTGVATWVVVDKTLNSVSDISEAPIISGQQRESSPNWLVTPSQTPVEKPQSNVEISSQAPQEPSSSQQPQQPSSSSQNASSELTEAQKPLRQQFMLPVSGEIINEYSDGELVKSVTLNDWRTHDGIDIAAPAGTEVKAAGDGTVMQVYNDAMWGKCIQIEHTNGLVSYYYSLDENVAVSQGDAVTIGQTIGTVSDTASCEVGLDSHLHFAVKERSEWINPIKLVG